MFNSKTIRGHGNVTGDKQWIRRCKQEEITLIDAYDDDIDLEEKVRAMK